MASTVTFYNITFAINKHIITAVGTVNNFTLAREYQVISQVIKYDLESNVNYSIQDPLQQKIFHKNLPLDLTITI
jgi:hypothetical protein